MPCSGRRVMAEGSKAEDITEFPRPFFQPDEAVTAQARQIAHEEVTLGTGRQLRPRSRYRWHSRLSRVHDGSNTPSVRGVATRCACPEVRRSEQSEEPLFLFCRDGQNAEILCSTPQ